MLPARRAELAAFGLTTAAVIYPAARRREWAGGAAGREYGAVAAAAGLSALACRSPATDTVGWQGKDERNRRLLAAGWLAHAVFDNAHRAGPGGRLPSWYAALCAGYDVAFAASLLKPRLDAHADPEFE